MRISLFRNPIISSSLAAVIIMLVMAGCSDDVLNINPKDNISDEAVWEDQKLADAYLNDIYGNLQLHSDGAQGSFQQIMEDAKAGMVRANDDWTSPFWMAPWSVDEEGIPGVHGWYGSPNPLEFWKYWVIRWTNDFIANIQETDFPEDYKNKREAEARWMRAYMHFENAMRYGGVPIVTDVKSIDADSSELFVERDSEKEVYDFILSEMDDIQDDLSDQRYDGARVTKWTALALKSRAALHAASVAEFGGGNADLADQRDFLGIPSSEADNYWQQAYDAANEVIENGPFSLFNEVADPAENYRQLFLTGLASNPEAIFGQEYDGENVSHNWTHQSIPAPSDVWSSLCMPTWSMVEKFEFQDGSSGEIPRDQLTSETWTSEELFGNRDPRFNGVMLYPEATWEGETKYYHRGTIVDGDTLTGEGSYLTPLEVNGTETDWVQAGARKSVNVYGLLCVKRTSNDDDDLLWDNDDTDWIEYRLGEMYLNAAEAAYHLGNESEAQRLINELRERADMPAVSLSGQDLRDQIRNERFVELSLEKQHWWDMRRWRIAEEEINGTRFKGANFWYHWDTKEYGVDMTNAFREPHVFQKRMYYLPLGTSRIADTKLEENPGY